MSAEHKKKLFSVVIAIYNNEKNIPTTLQYIVDSLSLFQKYEMEIIMVNDGSKDSSYAVMKEAVEKYPDLLKIVNLSRNFGQPAACACGIAHADGDAIGVISSDLQDPFELFVEMLEKWEEGYKFVMATREQRGDKGIAALGGKVFHKLINKFVEKDYPAGGCDFYLMDKKLAKEYLQLQNDYSFGVFPKLWLGYKHTTVPYKRIERKIGKSGYSILKKVRLAKKIFFTNSSIFLSFLYFASAAIFLLTILGVLGTAIFATINEVCILLVGMGICTSILLLGMAILGNYLWIIFDMQKEKPSYVVDEYISKINK